MKTFKVEFVDSRDILDPFGGEEAINNATSRFELVTACSKYDAKRIIKRQHREVVIKKITPYNRPDSTGFGGGSL